MRWHRRLGLWFGLFASSWLFSGLLSLEPFHWSGPGPSAFVLARLHAAPRANLSRVIGPVLELCRSQLQVRELEIAALGGLFAVCRDATRTRVIDLSAAPLRASERLSAERMRALLAAFPGAQLGAYEAPDDYYYPTHSQPIALPYLRLDLHDECASTFYLDPARVSVVEHMTRRKRLERWLYHGLHSFDLPQFYARRGLWRGALIGAMAVGVTLSALGLWMPLRRWAGRRGRGRSRS